MVIDIISNMGNIFVWNDTNEYRSRNLKSYAYEIWTNFSSAWYVGLI